VQDNEPGKVDLFVPRRSAGANAGAWNVDVDYRWPSPRSASFQAKYRRAPPPSIAPEVTPATETGIIDRI
jgi:hypothetical protein